MAQSRLVLRAGAEKIMEPGKFVRSGQSMQFIMERLSALHKRYTVFFVLQGSHIISRRCM